MKLGKRTIKRITLSNGKVHCNPEVITGLNGVSSDFIAIKDYPEADTMIYINKRHIVEILTTTGDVEADEFICQIL